MPGKKRQASSDAHLRQRAEAAARLEGGPASPTADELNRTLHELRVHQIELEMQNEELRKVQHELETVKERYLDLYDQAPVGYVTLGEAGLILEANRTAAALLGMAAGELPTAPITRFICPEDQDLFYHYRLQLFRAGVSQACELRMLNRDGAPFWVRLEAAIAQDPGGQRLVRMVLSDITERKRIEAERREFDERIRRTQGLESLGILAAGIAHNFNNLLTIIMGTASMREQAATGPEDLQACATILTACERGRALVQSLTQFANLNSTDLDPINLTALIDETCLLLGDTAGSTVEIDRCLPAEPVWILGDPAAYSTILMNLCLNSLDAMPDGGTLTVRMTVPGPDWVEVSIEDTGRGMAPDILAHATEPFFTTKPLGRGTGLGLSMAHGVVTAHGGTLAIASAEGRGTQVTFRQPRVPAPDRDEPAAAPAPPLRLDHVLLVDDDEDVRLLMGRMLRKAGVPKVEAVPGGEAALDYLDAGERPDVIILDQNMPGLDGVQTLAEVRGRYPDLPVLISSGYPGVQDWPCFRQPNVAVIQKPFSMGEVLEQLARFPPVRLAASSGSGAAEPSN